jgi:hypothetical protein
MHLKLVVIALGFAVLNCRLNARSGSQIADVLQNAARPHFRLPCRQNLSPSAGGALRSVL